MFIMSVFGFSLRVGGLFLAFPHVGSESRPQPSPEGFPSHSAWFFGQRLWKKRRRSRHELRSRALVRFLRFSGATESFGRPKGGSHVCFGTPWLQEAEVADGDVLTAAVQQTFVASHPRCKARQTRAPRGQGPGTGPRRLSFSCFFRLAGAFLERHAKKHG